MIRGNASNEVTVSVDGSAHRGVAVQWAAVAGATEYHVYRRAPSGTQQFWTVTGTSLVDTGAAGTAGAAPTTPGDRWVVKNLFELKNARDVVVERNIFENNWASGQACSGVSALHVTLMTSGFLVRSCS